MAQLFQLSLSSTDCMTQSFLQTINASPAALPYVLTLLLMSLFKISTSNSCAGHTRRSCTKLHGRPAGPQVQQVSAQPKSAPTAHPSVAHSLAIPQQMYSYPVPVHNSATSPLYRPASVAGHIPPSLTSGQVASYAHLPPQHSAAYYPYHPTPAPTQTGYAVQGQPDNIAKGDHHATPTNVQLAPLYPYPYYPAPQQHMMLWQPQLANPPAAPAMMPSQLQPRQPPVVRSQAQHPVLDGPAQQPLHRHAKHGAGSALPQTSEAVAHGPHSNGPAGQPAQTQMVSAKRQPDNSASEAHQPTRRRPWRKAPSQV